MVWQRCGPAGTAREAAYLGNQGEAPTGGVLSLISRPSALRSAIPRHKGVTRPRVRAFPTPHWWTRASATCS